MGVSDHGSWLSCLHGATLRARTTIAGVRQRIAFAAIALAAATALTGCSGSSGGHSTSTSATGLSTSKGVTSVDMQSHSDGSFIYITPKGTHARVKLVIDDKDAVSIPASQVAYDKAGDIVLPSAAGVGTHTVQFLVTTSAGQFLESDSATTVKPGKDVQVKAVQYGSSPVALNIEGGDDIWPYCMVGKTCSQSFVSNLASDTKVKTYLSASANSTKDSEYMGDYQFTTADQKITSDAQFVTPKDGRRQYLTLAGDGFVRSVKVATVVETD